MKDKKKLFENHHKHLYSSRKCLKVSCCFILENHNTFCI